MDLIYVPEVLTYGFFRPPQYRDYEQPWNRDYFNYEKSTQTHSQRLSQQHKQKQSSKEHCYLCRENKRRSLAAYIRGKSRSNSCHEIHEEEEEEEEERNATSINEENHDQMSTKIVKDNNELIQTSNRTKETNGK